MERQQQSMESAIVRCGKYFWIEWKAWMRPLALTRLGNFPHRAGNNQSAENYVLALIGFKWPLEPCDLTYLTFSFTIRGSMYQTVPE